MNKVDFNDYIIDIFQNLKEIQSSIKVLKDAVISENQSIKMNDIGNMLDIIIDKSSNTLISFDKYIDSKYSN